MRSEGGVVVAGVVVVGALVVDVEGGAEASPPTSVGFPPAEQPAAKSAEQRSSLMFIPGSIT